MFTKVLPSALIFIAYFISFSNGNTAKIRCNKNEMESLFNKLIVIGSSERKFPENLNQLNTYCRETSTLLQKMDQYKQQCLRDTVKNVVAVVSYSMRSQQRRMCKNRRSQMTRSMINSASCINRNKQNVVQCVNRVSDNFVAIKQVENRLKMPNICCQYVDLIRCASNVMKRNKCEDKLPALLDQVQGVMGNFVESTCGEYNIDNDRCEKLDPLPPVTSGSVSNGFVHNLVEIFDSIPQEK